MRKTLLVVALAVILSVGFLLNSPVGASAHSASQKAVTVSQGTSCRNYYQAQAGFAMTYATLLQGQVCWNGSSVWVTSLSCNYYSWGASLQISYCGAIHNNDSWAQIGANWQTSLIYRGSNISYPGYQRVNFDNQGRTSGMAGIG